MKLIKSAESSLAAETLHKALAEDPLIRWMFVDEAGYQQSVPIISTWVKYCVLYGLAYRTEQFESVALRKMPGDLTTSLWKTFRSGMIRSPRLMSKEAFDRMIAFDKLSQKVKQQTMQDKPFIYCWTLGTLPDMQSQGFGSELMNATFEKAASLNIPCYLEVANPVSKIIHQKKGYEILKEFALPDSDIQITAMLHE